MEDEMIYVVQCDRSLLLQWGFSANFFWRKKWSIKQKQYWDTVFDVMAATVWGFPDIAESQPTLGYVTLLLYRTLTCVMFLAEIYLHF